MNFLAMPTLKNDRACLRRPSSIRPFFSSNVTFESERTGIANVGSRRRCAASMTMSATPMSFFSTVVILRAFAAIGASYPFPRRARAFDLAVGWAQRGRRSVLRPCATRPACSRRALPWPRAFASALDAVGRDDDRVRQPFWAAPVLAEHLIGLLAAGPLQGHLVELLLQLRDREPAALEPVARLDDLLDVEREDVASALLAVGALPPPEKCAEAAAALAQRQRDFFVDLVVLGDSFLGLAGERNPDRGHVDEDHHGPGRQGTPRLRHAVVAPRRVEHRLEDGAGGLLIEERHAVRVADDACELVLVSVRLLALGERDRLLL